MGIERRKDAKGRVLKEGEHQRSNGTYEFKWTDKTGKRHSKYAKSLDELRLKEAEIVKDTYDGIRMDKDSLTVNDLYKRWLAVKKGLKTNTLMNYKYMYELFVQPDFGNMHIVDIKRTDVRAFYNYLSDNLRLKTNSIDNIHTVLHQVLELGVEDDYIRSNPSDNALKELKRAHSEDFKRKRGLTLEEQQLFEEFLSRNNQYHRWYSVFETMLWTGMRVGELTGLRWEDIDFEDNMISVNHTLVYFSHGNKCGYGINTTKTEAGNRTIPMMPKVKEALLMEKQLHEELDIKCNSIVDGYTDFVFLNRFGNVMNQATLNRALRRIIRDCNYEVLDKKGDVTLPKFSNHSLRHTFTTRLCEANINIKAIQDILGHADAETTLQIYTDATKDLKKREMIELEAFFS